MLLAVPLLIMVLVLSVLVQKEDKISGSSETLGDPHGETMATFALLTTERMMQEFVESTNQPPIQSFLTLLLANLHDSLD
jgi:hypothetical protein